MCIRFYVSLLFSFVISGLYARAPAPVPVSNESAFESVYENGVWGRDGNGRGNSGTGSDPKNAFVYLAFLQQFLADHQIASVVDLGCGDWRLGSSICWDGIEYLGIDVVKSVVAKNRDNFSASNISFVLADGVNYPLPAADLLICKDVLQHLPFADIRQVIKQFPQFTYCLIVNDVDPITLTCKNRDIVRGDYRQIDLTQPPFALSGRKVLTYSNGPAITQVLLIKNGSMR